MIFCKNCRIFIFIVCLLKLYKLQILKQYKCTKLLLRLKSKKTCKKILYILELLSNGFCGFDFHWYFQGMKVTHFIALAARQYVISRTATTTVIQKLYGQRWTSLGLCILIFYFFIFFNSYFVCFVDKSVLFCRN